jgi:hypothetical protein
MKPNRFVSCVADHDSQTLDYEQSADCVESALDSHESVSGWVTGPDSVFTRLGTDEYVLDKQALSERVDDYTHIDTDYPDELLSREQWVVQAKKKPRDPSSGHLYPAPWGSDTPREKRPLHTFKQAKKWLDMADSMMLDTPDDVSADELAIGYILPHNPPTDPSERVVFVDLDDVRDPSNGEIHPAAQEIVDELDSYTEISQSGEGLHCLCFASLPEHLGEVIADIGSEPFVGDKNPAVEIYDSGRYCSITVDVLHDRTMRQAQDTLETIIRNYTDEQVEEDTDDSEVVEEYISSLAAGKHESQDDNKNTYYSVEVGELASVPRGGRCDHPVHGSSTGGNFVTDGGWYCFRHDSSGSALGFIAMAEGIRNCDWFADNSIADLSRNELLEVCLFARDSYNFSDDWNPPLRALKSIAEDLSLNAADATKHYEALVSVYDRYDVSDIV